MTEMKSMSKVGVSNAQAQLLAAQLERVSGFLHGTMDGVTADVAHHKPGGKANPIAATVAHAITSLDGIMNGMIGGGAPLMMSAPTGLRAMPPMGEDRADWYGWGQELKVDLDAFHAYAQQVFDGVAQQLGEMDDAQLARMMPAPGGGEMSVGDYAGIALHNVSWHTGEIAVLKGLQGLKGYPA